MKREKEDQRPIDPRVQEGRFQLIQKTGRWELICGRSEGQRISKFGRSQGQHLPRAGTSGGQDVPGVCLD